MASLNKLAIRGIRSFDDKQLSVIEFFSPVTVIVGHNGSGKTTIIECLKYATTGDQPPGTRGGAFVHDPKMANEKEVKAQVKLRFYAANGQRMLAVRNLSVTMKKTGAMTMKTLESILGLADGNLEKGGKRGVISTKCAEMDVEIPHLLGVSKAVLENVIFCHQEDSYWPLSEPATLKKKFDDIFEATKYTKALDSIKALRKDRVAELKADKERLDSLYREKQHADKLRSRASEMSGSISVKKVEQEEAKHELARLMAANQKFYDSATKFRETYARVESLSEKKSHYQDELATARETLQEITGTDEELTDRLRNFDQHVLAQRRQRTTAESKMQDIAEDLDTTRKAHMDLLSDQGRLQAEAKAQEQLMVDREALVHDISAKHQIKGYDHSPLGKEKINEFTDKLIDLQRRQNTEADRLQSEIKGKSDEYNAKSKQLYSEQQRYIQQKDNHRDRVATLQRSIASTESDIEQAQAYTSQLLTLQADIEEKERRLKKLKDDMRSAGYEERLMEKTIKARAMDLRRDELNAEIRSLGLQADSRAKLQLKKAEVKSKIGEVKNILDVNNAKFRKLVGADAHPDTMERELARVFNEKDRERGELEGLSNVANKNLQSVETTLSNLKAQAKEKNEEVKRLDRQLRSGLDGAASAQAAIQETAEELDIRKEEVNKHAGSHGLYKTLLDVGKTKKCCPLCTRAMDASALSAFEKTVNECIKKSSPEGLKETAEEIKEWETELRRVQELGIIAANREKLKTKEIPTLEAQIQEKEEQLPELAEKAEHASARLDEVKKELQDITIMRQQASTVSKTQQAIGQLTQEIDSLEDDLRSTGSTKTTDDVQAELDALAIEIRANEREKQSLTNERDLQTNALRAHEKELNTMLVEQSDIKGRIRDKETLEKRVQEMRDEINAFSALIKELESKIKHAQEPMQQLEQEHSRIQRELDMKLSQTQRLAQELNRNVDKLENINRNIDRYVKGKREEMLSRCIEKIEEHEAEIQNLNAQLDEARAVVNTIDKEINESGALMANLRENLRVRKLIRDIDATQREIDTFDMEEAAKARRIFQEKYHVEKEKETELQAKCAHLGGELTSLEAQLKTLQEDLSAFKDITKKYRDQLIKVKMSDMANNDLEKYAKALDNAIMKYHSLKMEEVNDTMRHLWNKTYQGTDIDGIKISSDSEGGATKRSYNYRVVMTKDQVEMDMRGRCSAGQKMLASIIIRLALADSFSQNCGILALDEPTNALDTENIDALASSLIDIINERKNHANFQLIIITHDENFLRKLGQSDVMEYYWRVSRDSRQKSVIERHRFG